MRADDLPAAAWLVALSTLPRIGPRRLGALLEQDDARTWWTRIRSRGPDTWSWPVPVLEGGPALRASWRAAAADTDAVELWAAHRDAGIDVLTTASPTWPDAFVHDPDPPA